jgi:hypothetical protein
MTVADRKLRAEIKAILRRITSAVPGDGTLPATEYRRIVAELVTKLAHRSLPGAELYRRSLGAFPTIVKESLAALPGMPGALAEQTCPPDTGRIIYEPAAWEDDDLDPVDGQWYFDQPTVDRLLALLPTGTRSVLAMGIPTIAGPAARSVDEVTLLDRSRGLRGKSLGLETAERQWGLNVADWDLGEKPYLDAAGTDVVLMDPPWYLEHYRAWLHTAIEASKMGGLIGVVVPQPLTNRRSFADQGELLGLLSSVGQVSIRENVLSYVTPSFERPVLNLSGIGYLDRWRRADLALVRVRKKRLPYEFEPVPDIEWKHREIGGRIVRSWGESVSDDSVPVIRTAHSAAGYRLGSVSRYYLRSSDINLVTSRGRAAAVSRWGRLPVILDLLQKGRPLALAVETALPNVAAAEQQALVKVMNTILEA